MDESDPQLLSGEHVVFATKKHWFALVAGSGVAILMVIGALILAWLQTDSTVGVMGFINRVLNLGQIALFLGGIGWIIYNAIAWKSAEYTVTNRRLMGQEGLLRRRETDSLLSSISDVRMRQSAVGRMMGFGDVQIMSSSGSAGADKFTTVIAAAELKKHILEQKVAEVHPLPGSAMAAAADAAAVTPAAAPASHQAEALVAINSLAALRDSGAITPEEFEAKKAELLSRI